MEENLNSIAEYRLIPEFINNFSGDRKDWRARAIVNILIADKQVSIGGIDISKIRYRFLKTTRFEVNLYQL